MDDPEDTVSLTRKGDFVASTVDTVVLTDAARRELEEMCEFAGFAPARKEDADAKRDDVS